MKPVTNVKIGLALSGASSRSVFYIGFLEVLQEHRFPIDYIAALSGATIVAASYACGTMDNFKQLALRLNREVFFSLIEKSKGQGGLYSLEKFEELIRLYTKNFNFEDVSPQMGFVTTDINAREEVVLQMGDLAKAICASCSLPVVFEPQQWGNKILVDGGIINVVPGNVARDAGMDLVIGIDLRSTRHVFSWWQIFGKRLLNKIRALIWPRRAEQLWQRFADNIKYSEFWQNYFYLGQYQEPQLENPQLMSVIGRSLDIAIASQTKHKAETNFECDLLIVKDLHIPFWKRFLFVRFLHFDSMTEYYQAGRATAEEYLPKMWQLLKDRESAQQTRDENLKQLFINQK
ncbi:MAG TPA: patatin-like phospholipase family protein [Candidatus Doudnabacteria bacterium]|nr:patatin-like phospholipase family protein [Candidatus Doudnabacteria bacterium]